jgi:hypothetical protein
MALLIVILLVGGYFFYKGYQTRKLQVDLKERGYDLTDYAFAGSLIGGHPDIDKGLKTCKLISNADKIAICNPMLIPQGVIYKQAIKNVVFEDATTFGKRVSAGRVLLVGIFALAWRKKTKNESAYVIIDWTDERFEHSTSFLFEGKGSNTRANTCRNWLIKKIR